MLKGIFDTVTKTAISSLVHINLTQKQAELAI